MQKSDQVLLSEVPYDARQALWLGMQELNPTQSEALKDDPIIKLICDTFQGSVVIQRTDAEKYYRAGQKILTQQSQNKENTVAQ